MPPLSRSFVNLAARSLRYVRQTYFPNVDTRHSRLAAAYHRFVDRAGRLREIETTSGFRMYLDEPDSLRLSVTREFEPSETRFFREQLRPGQVVIDVGANIGYFTLLFARQVGPTGHVYAIEPEPRNFALLQQNIALNGFRNVTALQRAAWHEPSTLTLYLNEENRGDHRAYRSEESRAGVTIEAGPLDQLLGDLPRPVDLVKIDIQGSEYNAIRGMAGILARSPRVQVLTEFWPGGLRRCGSDPRGYLALLETLGFEFYTLHDTATVERASVHEILSLSDLAGDGFTNVLCRRPGSVT
jgi:FkbM family methyltransferase